jgi:hypothetical protein
MHELAFLLQNIDPSMTRKIAATILILIPVVSVILIAIVMIPCWFILKKAGFSPWLSLLCVIPPLGAVVILYVLAFAQWKVAPIQLVANVSHPPQS